MKTRYFFDIRSEGNLYPDEEGLELANEKAAGIEAALFVQPSSIK
jgi:uncharacterized protein DUF6894